MSEPKWTPGPWAKVQHGEKDSRVGAKTLLAIVYSEVYRDTKTQKANAHLIAAAPDLYAALEASYGTFYDKDCDLGRMVAAALAKARGESV